MPNLSFEGLAGIVLALLIVVLDQGGVKNQYVLWSAFVLALFLSIHGAIRAGLEKGVKAAIVVGLLVGFGIFAAYLWGRTHEPIVEKHEAVTTPVQPQPSSKPEQPETGDLQPKKRKPAVPHRRNPSVAQAPEAQAPTKPMLQTQTHSPPQNQPASPPPKIVTFDEFERERKRREQEERKAEPPCRGDDLKQCGDRGLLEWGKPLTEKMKTVADALSLEKKVARERYSGEKYLKAIDAAEGSAADEFRDCCAADAVRYHKELAMRLGGGEQDERFYQWAEMLLHPPRSKEWKAARSDSGRLTSLPFEFHQLENHMQLKIDLRVIDSMRQ